MPTAGGEGEVALNLVEAESFFKNEGNASITAWGAAGCAVGVCVPSCRAIQSQWRLEDEINKTHSSDGSDSGI